MKPSAPSRSLARRTLSHAAAVLSLLALPAALDAQSGSNPSPNYAAAFPFGGRVATDLRFSEWFFNDHTVMLRFMPQYPTGYQGPILTNDPKSPGATYSVGLANYQAGGVSATKLVVRIGTREQFYRTPLKRGQWYHLAVRRSKGRIDVFLDGQAFPLPPAQPFVVPATGLPAPSAPLIIGRRLLDPHQQFYGFVDDVAIYNFGASKSLIQDRMNSTLRLSGNEYGLLAGYTFDDRTPTGSSLPSTLNRWTSIQSSAYRALVSQNRSSAVDGTRLPLPVQSTVFQLPFDDGTHWRVGQNYGATASHNGNFCFCIDMHCTNRPTFGQPIRAAATGQVVRADSGAIRPGGYEVHVEHGSRGEHSEYVHGLGHYIIAFVGALGGVFQPSSNPLPFLWELAAPVPVDKGQQIAAVGYHPNGSHHHWATRTHETYFPIEFSSYQYYSGAGFWIPVAAGTLVSGETIRRTFAW